MLYCQRGPMIVSEENNMIKIAVVDDDNLLHKELDRYFSKFEIAYDFDFKVEYFFSCEEIYNKLTTGFEYDLLFLDIEFPEMKGTDFGKLLRRKLKNYDTQIVFISSIREYAMDLFQTRPIEFLIKPITYEKFLNCMLLYMTHYENSNGFLEYTMNNIKHRIRIREVVYLESHGKKVEFHTKRGEFMTYGKITDIIADYTDKFICISRGLYVNVQHIIEATPKEVLLTNNRLLRISRGCQNAVRDRLSEI